MSRVEVGLDDPTRTPDHERLPNVVAFREVVGPVREFDAVAVGRGVDRRVERRVRGRHPRRIRPVIVDVVNDRHRDPSPVWATEPAAGDERNASSTRRCRPGRSERWQGSHVCMPISIAYAVCKALSTRC